MPPSLSTLVPEKLIILPMPEKTIAVQQRSDTILQSITFRGLILFQVLAYGSYSVLVHMCEKNGAISFSSTTMNFLLESFKLLFSLCALCSINGNVFTCYVSKLQITSWIYQSLPYSIPGILYFINNNLAVHMQIHMDPASYQILSNFKILTTAVLYRLIMKHKLSTKQWCALTLLFVGSLIYSIGT